ncbi:MAG: hypothetical protein ACJASX_004223 [Limisphaerales bacterium]|jgi:hypothetical protein
MTTIPKNLLFLFSFLISIRAFGAEATPVIVKEDGRERVLLQFALTPDNIDLEVPKLYRQQADGGDPGYRLKEGGQFDVYIKREYFPVQIPESCCDSHLVLTMPYTNPTAEGGVTNVAAQKDVFDRIRQLKVTGKGTVPIAIDLTYYVEIEGRDPLKVKLRERQIYFRHKGHYIGHVKATAP